MADFEKLIDLAAERFGGTVCYASDDFFAAKENMLRSGRGEFVPGKYTDNGKWMDGWESRRRRDDGHDWAIVRLALPGRLRGVDVDTNHFLGNAPKSIRLEGAHLDGYVPTSGLLADNVRWQEILADSATKPGSQNLFEVSDENVYTHLKLHIYPDGGVARFRVYGDVKPNWRRLLAEHRVLDLAAAEHGGLVLAASDEFFGDRRNLIMPGRSANMGDGWETRRSRRPGCDWTVLSLGRPGVLARVELDTTHFKGNFPESASLEAALAPDGATDPKALDGLWKPLVPRTKLEAHTRHELTQLASVGPVSHVRLNIFPDGGVARLRLFGEPVV